MKFSNKPNKPHVTKDGETIWHSRSVTVVMSLIIRYKNTDYVLACKRGQNVMDAPGLWNMPCGYLDWGESGSHAVYREVWEETGIDISKLTSPSNVAAGVIKNNIMQPWYVDTCPFHSLSYFGNRQNVTLRYGLWLKLFSGLPETSLDNIEHEGEISEAKWIPLSKINDYDWAYIHKNIIEEYILKT